jgi:hypothetical protein
MDPYLEDREFWPDLHHRLITAVGDALAPQVAPRYRVRIERHTYLSTEDQPERHTRPDAAVITAPERTAPAGGAAVATVVAPTAAAETIQLPRFDAIHQGYIEIRDGRTHQVVTAIEVLSPTNKLPGSGRAQYLMKRREVTHSLTNLVEIDLLRDGPPMEMEPAPPGHYRIVVSPAWERPAARLYRFDVRSPIPVVPVPLRQSEDEATLAIGELLPGIYDRAYYKLDLDYTQPPPEPPLSPEDAAWVDALLHDKGLRPWPTGTPTAGSLS